MPSSSKLLSSSSQPPSKKIKVEAAPLAPEDYDSFEEMDVDETKPKSTNGAGKGKGKQKVEGGRRARGRGKEDGKKGDAFGLDHENSDDDPNEGGFRMRKHHGYRMTLDRKPELKAGGDGRTDKMDIDMDEDGLENNQGFMRNSNGIGAGPSSSSRSTKPIPNRRRPSRPPSNHLTSSQQSDDNPSDSPDSDDIYHPLHPNNPNSAHNRARADRITRQFEREELEEMGGYVYKREDHKDGYKKDLGWREGQEVEDEDEEGLLKRKRGRQRKEIPLREDRARPIPGILEVYLYHAALAAGRTPTQRQRLAASASRKTIKDGRLIKVNSGSDGDGIVEEVKPRGRIQRNVDRDERIKQEGAAKMDVDAKKEEETDDDKTEPEDEEDQPIQHIEASAPKPVITSTASTSQKSIPVLEDDDDTTEPEDDEADSQPAVIGHGLIGRNGDGGDVEYLGVWRDREGKSEDETDKDIHGEVLPPRPRDARKMAQWNKKKREVTKILDAQAVIQAKASSMKPDFPCSASRQRKKVYPLDPFDKTKVIPKSINRFLRRYQRLGVQFMYDRWKGVRLPDGKGMIKGGVLGDDMGLGKTVQVIAFLSAIMEKTGTSLDLESHKSRKERVRQKARLNLPVTPTTFGPTCLIACPGTLLDNWKRELQTWANFDFEIYAGSSKERAEILQKYKQGFLDVLLMSNDTARIDTELLMDVKFSVMIADEAHQMKNPAAWKTIAFKNMLADARFALTGTLMQNRYDEMWSVLDFVAPGQVGELRAWHDLITEPLEIGNTKEANLYDVGTGKHMAEDLNKYILPMFFLRRTKALVAHELPNKNDQVVFCPLTPIQELVYHRVSHCSTVQHYLTKDDPCLEHPDLVKSQCCQRPPSDDPDWVGCVLKYISIFKKISIHVALVFPHKTDGKDQRETASELLDICFPKPEDGHFVLPGSTEDMDIQYRRMRTYEADQTPDFSGKWLVLRELLGAWRIADRENRVLIFSESVRCLEIIYTFIQEAGYSVEFMHGGKKKEERQEMVDNFQNGNVYVFLISTLTGGSGLNLTQANKVIIYDPSWNPANDLQAMDRAFRMGQKRDVDVYRLIAKGTIEENVYERQLKKQAAMRIAYDASVEARQIEGREKGPQGDLWGAKNLFSYRRKGTTLSRVAKLLEEEEDLRSRLGADEPSPKSKPSSNIISRVTTLKIDTIYGEDAGGAYEVEESEENGAELTYNQGKASDDILSTLMDAFPGIIKQEHSNESKASAVEKELAARAKRVDHRDLKAKKLRAHDYLKEELASEATGAGVKRARAKKAAKEMDAIPIRAPRLVSHAAKLIDPDLEDD